MQCLLASSGRTTELKIENCTSVRVLGPRPLIIPSFPFSSLSPICAHALHRRCFSIAKQHSLSFIERAAIKHQVLCGTKRKIRESFRPATKHRRCCCSEKLFWPPSSSAASLLNGSLPPSFLSPSILCRRPSLPCLQGPPFYFPFSPSLSFESARFITSIVHGALG